ncbi:unnamed protein product [Diatraea saccharalis]|uniref:Proton-coupled folate transporter n=1 Tax=Diatraea saccharalis TaxID=40085 RepID=A0A9P0CCH3_9NEOP|nr:unnamed protein product [Diatraea saccharalis]
MDKMKDKMELQTDISDVKVNSEVEDKKEKEKAKEPFSLSKFIEKCFTFFTVEPYLLCYILPSIICSVGVQKLNMEKACRVDLNYTIDVCTKVVNGDTSDNITEEALIGASTLVADMTAWKDPLQTGIPAIFILFVGAWSDRTGNRKALLLIPIIGEVMSLVGLMIGTYYFDELPLWVMGLFQAMSAIFTGGLPVAIMGSYSFIADVTTVESRTFRIGVVATIVTLGIPLGTAISGILTEAVGYYGIFGIAIAMYVIGFIHTLFRIHDVRRTKIEGTFCYKLTQFFHPKNVWDTLSLLFLSRGRMLAQIALVIWAHIVITGPVQGEGTLLYLYTLNRYNMDIVDLSLFSTYSTLVGIAGTAIAVTVFSKWLSMHDSILGIIATTSKVLSSLIYGLAPTRDWFFVGPVFDIFGNSGVTAIRSLGTKIVDADNVGKSQH